MNPTTRRGIVIPAVIIVAIIIIVGIVIVSSLCDWAFANSKGEQAKRNIEEVCVIFGKVSPQLIP